MTTRGSFRGTPLWRRYLRFWGPAPDADIDEEFAFHMQSKIAELIGAGWNPADARKEAERAFGPVSERRRECLLISRVELERKERRVYFAGLWLDIRYAVRTLWKGKVSSACAFIILAISTGASTAVFTVMDATVFKPLPVKNAARLVQLQVMPDGQAKTDGSRVDPADPPYDGIEWVAERSRSLEQTAGVVVVRQPASAQTSRNAVVRSDAARGICVTGNYFDVLGVQAEVGRTLQSSDDSRSADYHVAVATYQFWRDRLGLDPKALGQTVHVGSVAFTLIGFLPERFQDIRKGASTDVYVPMAARSELLPGMFAATSRALTIGLLAPHATPGTAAVELAPLWDGLAHTGAFAPGVITGRLLITDASRGLAAINDEQTTSLYLVAAAIGLVLLIGCLNASCLFAAHGAARSNEIAIRRALGAGAGAILRQSLVESCLLAVASGAFGIALATWGERLILVGLKWGNRPIDLAPDARVLGFSLGLALGTGILAGLLPAFEALRTRTLEIHRDAQLRPFRSGKVLIAMQVALSLVLVSSAGMFLRGIGNLRSTPLGFNARDVDLIRVYPNYDQFPSDGAHPERYFTSEASRLRERLMRLPGMEISAFTTGMTFTGGAVGYPVSRADGTGELVKVTSVHVDDRYFDVLGIPLLAGRRFSERDDGGSERVVIVNRSLATRIFGSQSPVGQRVAIGTTTASVVGIAGDIRMRSVKAPPVPIAYLPFWQPPAGTGWSAQTGIHVKTREPLKDVVAGIDDEIKSGGYALRVYDSSTLEDAIGASYLDDRIRMQAASLFAAIALVLVVAGIYGLMAYSVARRTREIGVRMAIGAAPNQIVGLILKESMTLVGIGILLGTPGALVAMRALSVYVFDVSPVDPASIGAALAVMAVAACVAAAVPAWRSTHVDPVTTLRAQ